jgi:hypothetical protein
VLGGVSAAALAPTIVFAGTASAASDNMTADGVEISEPGQVQVNQSSSPSRSPLR